MPKKRQLLPVSGLFARCDLSRLVRQEHAKAHRKKVQSGVSCSHWKTLLSAKNTLFTFLSLCIYKKSLVWLRHWPQSTLYLHTQRWNSPKVTDGSWIAWHLGSSHHSAQTPLMSWRYTGAGRDMTTNDRPPWKVRPGWPRLNRGNGRGKHDERVSSWLKLKKQVALILKQRHTQVKSKKSTLHLFFSTKPRRGCEVINSNENKPR